MSSHPIGEGILTVLDDGSARFIAIIRLSSLARSDGGIVNELEKMLSVASDDGNFFAVLTYGVELIGIGSLDLFTSDVGELSLGNQ